MCDSKCKELKFALFFVFMATVTATAKTEDIDCRPRETLVATGGHPQFKLLHRCSGIHGNKNPLEYRCVAIERKTVQMEIQGDFGLPEQLELVNETKCATKCVCGDCPGDKHQMECDSGYSWNLLQCQCTPSCLSKPSTGGGEKSTGVSYTVLIAALAAELVVVLVIVFVTLDACRCRRQKKGVIYKTRQYVRHLSAGSAEQHKLHLNGELSGSVFIEVDPDRTPV